jgi:hypothetical protein
MDIRNGFDAACINCAGCIDACNKIMMRHKKTGRHLSAGHHYHIHTWWQPGLFGLALIFHWLILMICILTGGINSWMLLLFLAGVLFRAYRYGAWTRHLGDRDTVVWYPVLEAFYVAYLAVMGMFTLLTKKKSWT